MGSIRFKHVFAVLLLMSGVSAFVWPRWVGEVARGKLDQLLTPVAWPARKIGEAIHLKVAGPPKTEDPFRSADGTPRSAEQLLQDNQQLTITIANLLHQMDELQQRLASSQRLGDIGRDCKPFAVTGSDAARRESLILRGSSRDGLKEGMAVLCPGGGLAGRIVGTGVAGAQVQLLTDPTFSVIGKFTRPRRKDDGSVEFLAIPTPPPLVQGMGGGRMAVKSLKRTDVEASGLAVGDWVVLQDRDGWPPELQQYKIGEVESIGRDPSAAQFALIVIRPHMSLMQLAEVWVLMR